MTIKSITGYCEQCGSKGSVHLVIKGEEDYDWCCGKCLEKNTYEKKTLIPDQIRTGIAGSNVVHD